MNEKIKPHLTRCNIGLAVLGLLLLLGLHHQWAVRATLARMANDSMGAVLGAAQSRNVIVEFMDYRCSGCRAFAPTLAAFLQKHPDVRIVIRHYPFYGAESVHEAQLALAAAKQGKFAPMHDYLNGRADPAPTSEIPAIAQQLGLDPARLASDAKDPGILAHIGDTVDSASFLNIPSEPSFIINGTVFVPRSGPVPDLDHFEAVYNRLARP